MGVVPAQRLDNGPGLRIGGEPQEQGAGGQAVGSAGDPGGLAADGDQHAVKGVGGGLEGIGVRVKAGEVSPHPDPDVGLDTPLGQGP